MRPQRRAPGRTDRPTDRRTEGAGGCEVRLAGSAGGAGRGGSEGSGAGGRREEGRRRARRRLGSGVGPETLPWPVGSRASAPRQRKAEPRIPSPSVSFLYTQRKINTREGKTIAGPPGTRGARRAPPSGAGVGGATGSDGPTSGPPSRLAPADGRSARGAGIGGRRKEFPGVKRLAKVW